MSEYRAIADKLGVDVSEIKERHLAIFSRLRADHPTMTENIAMKRAYTLLRLELRSELRSPAKPYNMVCFGLSSKRDIMAGTVAEILTMDRHEALSKGLVQEGPDGRPIAIDMRETFSNGNANRNYGKPILPVWRRQSVFLASPAVGNPDPKILLLTQQGEALDRLPTIGMPCRARINLRENHPDKYIANSSVTTKFEPIPWETSHGKTNAGDILPDEIICELLSGAPTTLQSILSDLQMWHEAHQEDWHRVVIVEGDLVSANRTAEGDRNFRVGLLDESIGYDPDAEEITGWVPQELKHQLDGIGEGSRVKVIGGTGLGPSWNAETRSFDRETPRVMLNVMGIFVTHPDLLVYPAEEDIPGGT